MFKQLKRRLLILNMLLISALIFFAFSSIYFMTLNRMNIDIHNQLIKVSEPNPKIAPEDKITAIKEPPPNEIFNRMVSFSILVDDENKIIGRLSFFEEDDIFYEEALKLATQLDTKEGRLIYDDTHWAFMRMELKEGTQFVFLDINPQIQLLNKMLYSFVAVSFAVLFITFILSRYLTKQSLKPIEETFSKQVQFISDASHEIKTPLAVIKTNVDVLIYEHKNTDSEKWLQYIHSEVTRMTELTEQLLYLSNMDHSALQRDYEEVNLSLLCEHTALGLEAVAFEKKIDFKYEIDDGLYVHGHPKQLTQVILILLDNAFKYNIDQGYVHLKLTLEHQKIILTVENSGPVIPESAKNQIFDRFYKVDPSRQNGHGLGLSIAQAIVRSHQGKITYTQNNQQGNLFTIKFQKNKNVG